jgi:putative FmdB family regulatory protein
MAKGTEARGTKRTARERLMPTYEYACTSCGHHVEIVQSFSDEPLTTCPKCHGHVRKVFGSIGIVLKGSGFYRTDNRSSTNGASVATEKTEKTERADKADKAGRDTKPTDGAKPKDASSPSAGDSAAGPTTAASSTQSTSSSSAAAAAAS